MTLIETLSACLCALENGEVVKAAAIGKDLWAQSPYHPEVLHVLAVLAERQGNLAQAMIWRRQAIAHSTVAQGNILLALERSREARELYDEALKIDTYNMAACNALAAMFQVPAPFDPKVQAFGRPPLDLYKTPIGSYFVPSDAPNDIVIRRMRAGKVFEEEIIEAVRPYVRSDSVVLDVGANFGQMSLLFSDLVGPGGHVYAFEADDFICYVLKLNIAINRKTNISAIDRAVYDTCDEILKYPRQDFARFESYGSYGIDPNASEGRAVKTITIDSLGIEAPISVIKVDIQGSDIFALRGAVETIRRHQPAIIFEYEEQFQAAFKTSARDYDEFIRNIGYRAHKVVNGINYLILPGA